MIGTSFEMLYYMSLMHDTRIKFGTTIKRMNKLRERIVRQIIDEDEVISMLNNLDCKMIRPKYILPAIIKDKTGKIYDENTFVRSFGTAEEKKLFSHHIYAVGKLAITEEELKTLVKSKDASIIEFRLVIPSVWSYEPDVEEWLPEHTKVVKRILGF